jgi:hypothetical protein
MDAIVGVLQTYDLAKQLIAVSATAFGVKAIFSKSRQST